ncbi:uncharacterized protein METZ01_LOCUS379404, partial [marine metagenome]
MCKVTVWAVDTVSMESGINPLFLFFFSVGPVPGHSLFFLDCESIMYFSPLLKSSFSLGVVSLTVAIVAASAVPAMAGN